MKVWLEKLFHFSGLRTPTSLLSWCILVGFRPNGIKFKPENRAEIAKLLNVKKYLKFKYSLPLWLFLLMPFRFDRPLNKT